MCAVCTHVFPIFPATPTRRVRALRHTPCRWVQRSSEKRLRRLLHLPCDKRLPEKFLPLIFRAFFFRRPATPESAAICSLPRGGGLGRGHSPNCSNLPQHPNRPNTSLAACCPLSNSLPRGERTGWLLGFKGAATLTHRVRALRHIPYRWVQRSSEKTLAAFAPPALR